MNRRVVVADIGTNTARVLAATVDGGVLTEEFVTTEVVGLGRGLYPSRVLQGDAIARVVAALAPHRDVFAAADAAQIVATSASRDALNREQFFDTVAESTGVRPTLISGEHEAAMAFAGAASAVAGPVMVVDIGGGSTEFVSGHVGVESAVSIDIGSVRLTELHLGVGPVSQQQLAEARAVVAEALSTIAMTDRTVVGVAGTVTTVAGTLLGLDTHDRSVVHLASLDSANVTELADRLATMTTDEIARVGTIGAARAPVILGGLLVLEGAFHALGVEVMVASERDILHGAAMALVSQ